MCRLSWFLDPGGWGKVAAVELYFIFLGICTLSLIFNFCGAQIQLLWSLKIQYHDSYISFLPDCSLKIREPDVPAPWFLDPGGWSKTAAVSLYFIFPGICTLSLVKLIYPVVVTADVKVNDEGGVVVIMLMLMLILLLISEPTFPGSED
ncbi:hypothetical protein STEG23_017691 [Scotinomys teguina]